MKASILFVLTLFSVSSVLDGQTADEKKSLQGLSSVFIVVQPINEDAAKDGLSAAHVRSVVESTLGQAGIPVAKEPQQNDGYANLIVTIDTIKSQGVYLFTVQVGVVQMVQLMRNLKMGNMPAQTWGAVSLGLTTPQRMEIVDEPLKDKLADFVKVFKAANGR